VLGAATVIAFASAAYRAVALDDGRQAVLTAASQVAARFQPTDTGTEHFSLEPGTPVRLVDQRESWAEVERCDGRRGWLPLSTLGVLRDRGPGLPERGNPEE
jgi:SH3-like domain-containing protein